MSTQRSASGLRAIAPAFVAAAPTGVRIRTRLHPTPAEEAALAAIGTLLGALYRTDLAARIRLGKVPAAARNRTERKRNLTAVSSSRWAGSITRAAEDQYQLGMRGLAAEAGSLRAACAAIENAPRPPAEQSWTGSKATRPRANATRKPAALPPCRTGSRTSPHAWPPADPGSSPAAAGSGAPGTTSPLPGSPPPSGTPGGMPPGCS